MNNKHYATTSAKQKKNPVKGFLNFLLIVGLAAAAIYGNRELLMDWFDKGKAIVTGTTDSAVVEKNNSASAKKNDSSKKNTNSNNSNKSNKSDESDESDEVVITVPQSMTFDEYYEGSVYEKYMAYGDGIEVKKNKDGSYTYTMTKERHNTLMDDVKKGIENGTEEILNANPYSNIRDIKYNEDYTEVYIYMGKPSGGDKTSEYISGYSNLLDVLSISAIAFAIPFYQLFSGVPADDINTDYIYIDTSNDTEFYRFSYSGQTDFSELFQ